MSLRDIVIRATLHAMTFDETVELWIKKGAAAWALEDEVPVEDPGPTQDFTVLGLESGVLHVAQIRATREGRYRAGYLGGNPEDWPDESRLEFYPGAEPAAAPTINSTAWERTSGVSQKITVNITPHPDHLDLDIELERNGVVVETIAAPHAGTPFDVDNVDPPLGASHTYTAHHIELDVEGADSAPAVQWSGPDRPSSVILTDVGAGAGLYQVDCVPADDANWASIETTGPSVYSAEVQTDAGGTAEVTSTCPSSLPNLLARARRKETAFAVDDWSDYRPSAGTIAVNC